MAYTSQQKKDIISKYKTAKSKGVSWSDFVGALKKSNTYQPVQTTPSVKKTTWITQPTIKKTTTPKVNFGDVSQKSTFSWQKTTWETIYIRQKITTTQ